MSRAPSPTNPDWPALGRAECDVPGCRGTDNQYVCPRCDSTGFIGGETAKTDPSVGRLPLGAAMNALTLRQKLRDLCSLQDDITHLNRPDITPEAREDMVQRQTQREALIDEIVSAWRFSDDD